MGRVEQRMGSSEDFSPGSPRILTQILVLACAWATAVGCSLAWNLHLQAKALQSTARGVARTYLENDNLYRLWNVGHGGVYVPLASSAGPDPFLAELPEAQGASPRTASGEPLTRLSHAAMMREVYNLAGSDHPLTVRITSLNPLNSANSPDPWEQNALQLLEEGREEVFEIVDRGEDAEIRLMRPFLVEERCLECHGRQGYNSGDLRGGIEVSLPLSFFDRSQAASRRAIWGVHLAALVSGFFLIGLIFAGMSRRLEERQRAEGELAWMRSYLQNMIDAMPSVLIGIDRDGRISLLNKRALQESGLQSHEVLGRRVGQIFPKLADKMVLFQEAMGKGQPLLLDAVPCTQVGSRGYADLGVYPLDDIAVGGAVIRIDDVTERVLQEDQKSRLEKMNALAVLSEGVAHEINNPLAGILQGAQGVSFRLSPRFGDNEKVASECGTSLEAVRAYAEKRKIVELIDGIFRAGERAAKIVSYMLQFSRCANSAKEPRDLAAIVDRTIEVLRFQTKGRTAELMQRVEIVKEFEADLPVVECAGGEIEQVVSNLLKNSVQALGSAGIESPRVVLRLRRDGEDAVRFEVEDNGPGMPEEVRKRIFDPFFTTKPPGEGVGLGLAVTYFIITVAHRGEMQVDSEPGMGARFTVRLPVRENMAAIDRGTRN